MPIIKEFGKYGLHVTLSKRDGWKKGEEVVVITKSFYDNLQERNPELPGGPKFQGVSEEQIKEVIKILGELFEKNKHVIKEACSEAIAEVR